MKKEFSNYKNLVNYGRTQNIPFLFISNEKLLLSIDNLMNQREYKSAIANMGDLSESMVNEFGKNVLGLPVDAKKGIAKNLSTIISTLIRKQLFDILPYDIELRIRFIAFNRNYSSHGARTDQSLCQAMVCYEYFHEVINWFLIASKNSSEFLPDFKLMSDNIVDVSEGISNLLPPLKIDNKFNNLLPEGHTLFHDSIIYDYLIKQETMESISEKYFPNVKDPNVVYAVLKGIYGIDRSWKKIFKASLSNKEKLRLLVNSIDSKENKVIHRALNKLKI
jgi:hypothetical protein